VRIGFVVQRYGTEILGGSEYHCRLIAEKMALQHDVEVLTTCAQDYLTWKNEYPEGADRVRGVTVRRFANAQTRDIKSFNQYSDWIFNNPHTQADEMEWLRRQGPWCPALLEYLEQHALKYEVLIFFTYLYAPTVLGIAVAPGRSILVPTAHDEPAIHLDLYRDVFSLPAGVAYNTDAERAFLRSNFDIRTVAENTVGCGVEFLPHQLDDQPKRGGRTRRRGGGRSRTADSGKRTDNDNGRGSHLRKRGAAFLRRHRLHGPVALYGGRIEPGKGCEELIEYFSAYAQSGGDATLTLMGIKLMPLPEESFVRFAGQLSEQERFDALEAATVVIVPSPLESLSLLTLEAFAVGTPILANGRSEVVVDHCRRSNAGLYYGDQDEFVECLKLLLVDERLRLAMGRKGQDYVQNHYRWDVILDKYEQLISSIRGRSSNTRGSTHRRQR
jgi:glycosyltransferase involved in cell wall biosynthesis|tara:strand:+ start:3721 stop:5049 length:1329 start_codon:yes stop_codon:yes gene_type:complete